jgi:regulator of cell morphogenesis and NO signaling
MMTKLNVPPGTTINDMIRLYPETVRVFHAYGLDACCGGGLPVVEAATRHGLDVEELLAALAAAAGPAEPA